jgi:hypothetical protein
MWPGWDLRSRSVAMRLSGSRDPTIFERPNGSLVSSFLDAKLRVAVRLMAWLVVLWLY